MASGRTVHSRRAERKRSTCKTPLTRARVRFISGDILGAFADEVGRSRGRIQRLTIVSPWVTHEGTGGVLARLLERAERDGASVTLITRPDPSAGHLAAMSAVEGAARGRVLLNERLHAKMYICELGGGRGFALIGSANMTTSSKDLDEMAILVRPLRGSRMLSQLAPAAARLARRSRPRRSIRLEQRRRS
jgi:hypothetical protein